MGIQDLFKVLGSRCPDHIHDFHLSQWTGTSAAVDISIFMNKYVKSAGDKLWMNIFFLFLCTLKKHNIKAVCIFDGPNPPQEKIEEQNARREQAAKGVARLKRATEIRNMLLKEYIPKDVPLEEDLQEECQKLLGYYSKTTTEDIDGELEEITKLVNRQKYQKTIDWAESTDVYDSLKELVDRLERQTAPITNHQREQAWDIVKMMGLPTFQADGEAEALCAYMCIHGYVDAVLTEDTDVLAYGTPWMLAFKDYKLSDEKVKGIYLPDVLDILGYDMDEFRDLCILLSCDYNKRVKGYPPTKSGKPPKNPKPKSIGWVGALDMIDLHRTLEECENYIDDIEPLKYERCRELFTPITDEELISIIQTKPYNMKPDFDAIREFIFREGLTVSVEYIQECWKPVNIIIHSDDDNENGEQEEIQSEGSCNEEKEEDDSSEEEDDSSEEEYGPYYAELIASCGHHKAKTKSIKFYVIFRDSDHFDDANDSGFDEYIGVFNEWISKWNKGYYIDDVVECYRSLREKPKGVEILDVSDV